MQKIYLLTPGPTPIPESVLSAMGQPIIHHRTPAFMEIFARVQKGLQAVFQTQQDVLILTSTGTGAMDATVSNLFSPGETVITVNGGKFGERWTQIAKSYGLVPVEIKVDSGDALDPLVLDSTLQQHPQARAVLFQASETSTGVQHPVQKICEIARKHKVLSVCDAITACGVFDLPMDRWAIDVLITGSQKAFMIPPGLAMVALSDLAWQAQRQSKMPRFYFDFAKERKGLATHQTAWTPAISLIMGLDESLKIILKDGLQATFARHQMLAEATRAGVQALGLELLAKKPEYASPAVTAVRIPPQISQPKAIPQLLRDRYGITIVGGQDELEGKILRLSHFGYCDRFDIVTVISGLEMLLHQLGYPVELGRGVAATLRVFLDHQARG